MTSRKNKSVDIKKYKNKRELNLGIFLFAIVFLYLVVTIILYFTGDQISVYEVREGSIVKDNSYTGLVIRQETAVNAEADGYISYYQNDNSKVKTGMNVYAITQQQLTSSESQTEETENRSQTLNPEIQNGITLQVQNFNENYDPENFKSVYSLKNEISTSLQNAFSTTRTEQLSTAILSSGIQAVSYTAPRDGTVTFTVDGYESLTKDSFTAENFDRSKYESTVLSDQMKITAGTPVYRLITSEDWSVIVQLDRETAEQLKADEVTSIKVRIDKDSETMWAGFSIITKDGDYYGCLDFDNSMIRYAQERYLNIELIFEDESGLKIPKSSLIEEKFYVVPEEYITTGGNSSASGVMVKKENGEAVFQQVEIYNTSEEGEVFINRDSLSEGTMIIKPESTETYKIGKIKALKGVYNINKGYAVFKAVNILCENDEYYIVQEGDSYGLYNYDHIVQDGTSVNPDEVVFQ